MFRSRDPEAMTSSSLAQLCSCAEIDTDERSEMLHHNSPTCHAPSAGSGAVPRGHELA